MRADPEQFELAYLVDKCWSVAARLPSACPDQNDEVGRIDSPWPSDMVQYETVRYHCMYNLLSNRLSSLRPRLILRNLGRFKGSFRPLYRPMPMKKRHSLLCNVKPRVYLKRQTVSRRLGAQVRKSACLFCRA
jgi:hypothetical protein